MKILITFLICSVCSILYAYQANTIQQCNNGYTQECLQLIQEAKAHNDSKNAILYQKKFLDILDNACNKEYDMCLLASMLYENKNKMSKIGSIIQQESMANRIPKSSFVIGSINNKNNTLNFDDKVWLEKTFANLSVIPSEESVQFYQEKSVPLLESACYSDDIRACMILSYFYQYDVAVSQNRPKAKRLVDMALDASARKCMLGDTSACPIIEKYPDYKQYINKFIGDIERKCNEGDSLFCYRAMLYYTQNYYTQSDNTKLVNEDKIDFVKSAKLLQRACYLDKKQCQESIFRIPNAKECLQDNNMKACAKVPDNRNIEFLSLACDSGDLQSCYVMRNFPFFKNPVRYVKYLQKLCRGGVMDSCKELSDIYHNGTKVSKSEEKSSLFAQKVCMWNIKNKASNNGEYCYQAGLAYELGKFRKQDFDKAIMFYNYACQTMQNNGEACQRLGTLYETYKRDNKQAFRWYEKACKSKDSPTRSCMKIAQAYYDGKDIAQNREKAIGFYEQTIAKQSKDYEHAYFALANIYMQPEVYNQETQQMQENNFLDYAKSLEYYKKACKMGIDSACSIDVKIPNLIQQCEAEHPNACYQIASLYDLLQKDSTYKEKIKGIDIESFMQKQLKTHNGQTKQQFIANLYAQSCKKDVALACLKAYENKKLITNIDDSLLQQSICKYTKHFEGTKQFCIHAGKIAILQQNYGNVIDMLEDSIYQDDPKSLDSLIAAYFFEQRYKKVLDLYRFVYQSHIPNDYYYLGMMYEKGLGLKADYTKALEIYQLSKTPMSYLGQARIYENGLGVYRDSSKADDFYELACPLQSKEVAYEACLKIGQQLQRENKLYDAQKYYNKVCAMGIQPNNVECQNSY